MLPAPPAGSSPPSPLGTAVAARARRRPRQGRWGRRRHGRGARRRRGHRRLRRHRQRPDQQPGRGQGLPAERRDADVAGPRHRAATSASGSTRPPSGVYDYRLTGAADPERMVTAPTVVFASKVPVLTPAQLAGVRISDLRLRDDTLVVTFSTAAGTLKVQAKDAAQGGIFQMEQEFGAPVEFVHTLGAGSSTSSTSSPGRSTSATAWTRDATPPDAAGQGQPAGGDQDSSRPPRSPDGRWPPAAGWAASWARTRSSCRPGATNCTSDCQAQNRIQGSLPVPPDPTDPTPIG